MRKFKLLALFGTIAMFLACETTESEPQTTDSTEITEPEVTPSADVSKYVGEVVAENGTIKLHKLLSSPQFVTAGLKQVAPAPDKNYMVGPTKFTFEVDNYELGAQTVESTPLANSDKGQHIHLILNNEPYSAHYTAEFDKELPAGDYVSLAFLSRSYHESLKNEGAYVLSQFAIGTDKLKNPMNLTQPIMIYSRPKGEYTGAATQYVMLDFYLVNVDLSAEGYKVRATINGTEFLLTTWEPYVIEGLPLGENTVKLELLDAVGNLVDNRFNPVERNVTLSK